MMIWRVENFARRFLFPIVRKCISLSREKQVMKARLKPIAFIFILLTISLIGFSQTEFQQFSYPNGQVASEGVLRDGKLD